MSPWGSAGPPNPRAAVVAEWIAKAEADLDLGKREYAFTGRRNLDMIGFLLQQAVEKLMKAVLIDRGVVPPKIHDLDVLDRLLTTTGVGPSAGVNELSRLTLSAVRTRYPGASLTEQDAAEVMKIADLIWSRLRPLV